MNPVRSVALLLALAASVASAQTPTYFSVTAGAHPHDVAATREPGGPVYYTAQMTGKLGILDPATGKVDEVPLGRNSAPHGVVVGPDGAPWITDGGQNAIVRVDPATGDVRAWRAPRGTGPYGITTTPSGDIYYASLAGSHIARIDVETGEATVIEPPTPNQGARRVWSDSKGNVWVSYWNTGQVGRYDPATKTWREWKLPGDARTYSVWVDPDDRVWLTDWSTNAIVRFDPATERFTSYPSDKTGANVRQMLGRAGEAWGAESGTDRLVRIATH